MPPRGRPPRRNVNDAASSHDGETASNGTEDDDSSNERPSQEINQNNNEVNQPLNANGGIMMPNLIAALQGFVQQQTQAALNAQEQLANPPNSTSRVVEQFWRYSPPKFNGRSGPLEMEEWLRELERIFEHIECTDAQRVSCAVFQLSEDAGHWWESYRGSMTIQTRQDLTWNVFKEIVTNKYFPRSYRNQKEAEFLDLKQGSLSVTDYERKFNRLSRYAARLVETEDQKADRFLRGLRPEIRGILAAQGIEDYGLAVRRAQEVASGLEMDVLHMDRNGKRKSDQYVEDRSYRSEKQRKSETKPEGKPSRDKPLCPTCRKYHNGECMAGTGNCYSCHQPGHNAKNCPNGKRREREKQGNARLFQLAQFDSKKKS